MILAVESLPGFAFSNMVDNDSDAIINAIVLNVLSDSMFEAFSLRKVIFLFLILSIVT